MRAADASQAPSGAALPHGGVAAADRRSEFPYTSYSDDHGDHRGSTGDRGDGAMSDGDRAALLAVNEARYEAVASSGGGHSSSGGPTGVGVPASRQQARLCGAALVLVVVGVIVGTAVALSGSGGSSRPPSHPWERVCLVFCEGRVLAAVQDALPAIHNDSKTFVDQPLLADPEDVVAAFDELIARLALPDGVSPTALQLQPFLTQYFGPSGSDLLPWTPPDYSSSPPLLTRVSNASVRAWAADINDRWKVLGRQPAETVHTHPQRHTLLAPRHPLVVPGGRFHESYYWDSYWIVQGLLACGMTGTARGVAQNLLDQVDLFGFVPNGGRAYYLQRSQPPMLSEMVRVVHAADPSDAGFLTAALASLDREYAFWMTFGDYGHAVNISVPSDDGVGDTTVHTLNRYVTDSPRPRPESYREDVASVRQAGYALGSAEAAHVLREIAAGAETGWDFSSRWFADGQHVYSCRVSDLLPVELNAILLRMEKNLAALHTAAAGAAADASAATTTLVDDDDGAGPHVTGTGAGGVSAATVPTARRHMEAAASYAAAAARRESAIEAVLWVDADAQWRDYVLSSGTHSAGASVSNFLPLWAGLEGPQGSADAPRVLAALQASGLVQAGGTATTAAATGQQWDWPNAWPPLQQMLIEGLRGSSAAGAADMALQMAREWLYTGYVAFARSGWLYEKYRATQPGVGGGGGEYVPQVGFGWTNGVFLMLLDQYDFASLDPPPETSDAAVKGLPEL